MQRVVDLLLARGHKLGLQNGMDFEVELTALHVYNEQLHDLLARGVTASAALEVLHDPLVGPYCPAAVRQPLFSSEQVPTPLTRPSR